MHTRSVLSIALAIAITAAAFAQPRSRASDDADQRELYNYSLTMDKIRKVADATASFADFAKKHPELQGQSSNSKNLDEMVRKFEKYPEAVAILKQQGLTPREYAVGVLTLMQASMAVGFKKSGAYKEYPPDMLKLVSKPNLDFVDQHYDEIVKLTAKMQPKDDQ